MTTITALMVIAGVILLQALIWLALLWWMKRRSRRLVRKLLGMCRMTGDEVVVEPLPGLYRGSDARFGRVKGNGVICLTGNKLIFEKFTGQRIEISRSEIEDATVEETFRGKPSFATGGNHVVIRTKDGNRIGFLLKNAQSWVQKINSC